MIDFLRKLTLFAISDILMDNTLRRSHIELLRSILHLGHCLFDITGLNRGVELLFGSSEVIYDHLISQLSFSVCDHSLLRGFDVRHILTSW